MLRIAQVVGVFLFLLLAAGCSAEEPTCSEWHPHTSLTEGQRAQVAAAVAKWNGFAGAGTLRWNPQASDDATCSVRVVAEGSEDYQHASAAVHGDFVGAWLPQDTRIDLTPERLRCGDRTDECVGALVLHELGHSLGLKHTHARSVMWNGNEFVTSFVPADYVECVRVGVCSAK